MKSIYEKKEIYDTWKEIWRMLLLSDEEDACWKVWSISPGTNTMLLEMNRWPNKIYEWFHDLEVKR